MSVKTIGPFFIFWAESEIPVDLDDLDHFTAVRKPERVEIIQLPKAIDIVCDNNSSRAEKGDCLVKEEDGKYELYRADEFKLKFIKGKKLFKR